MKASLLVFVAFASSIYGRIARTSYKDAVYLGQIDDARNVVKYIGIPYAQPPVGKLRLQPPRPLVSTARTADASKDTSNKCYGIENHLLRIGSEDCLALDIVRPNGDFNHLLPVYFFIHGQVISDINYCCAKNQLTPSAVISIGEISQM